MSKPWIEMAFWEKISKIDSALSTIKDPVTIDPQILLGLQIDFTSHLCQETGNLHHNPFIDSELERILIGVKTVATLAHMQLQVLHNRMTFGTVKIEGDSVTYSTGFKKRYKKYS